MSDFDNITPPPTEWASFLDSPAGYDPYSPLVRTCSADLPFSETWVNSLISEAPPPHTPHHPLTFYGELEDRRIEISNFDPETTTRDLISSIASSYGELDSLNMSEFHAGKITIKFYDLRDAHRFRAATVRIGGLTWQLQFAFPEKIADLRRPPNNGTLVLFHVPPEVTEENIRDEMKRFGAIREIRAHADQRFVEFWDTRDCQAAVAAVRGKKMFGSRVAIEFSRPGGYRKNPDAFISHRKPVVSRVSKKKAKALNEQIALDEQTENVSPSMVIVRTERKKRVEFKGWEDSAEAA